MSSAGVDADVLTSWCCHRELTRQPILIARSEEWCARIPRGGSADNYECVRVDHAHHGSFLVPLFGIVLDYAQRVDPDVLQVQQPGYLDCVSERRRKGVVGHLEVQIGDVVFDQLDWLTVSPAMA